jgi:hypothetical protein
MQAVVSVLNGGSGVQDDGGVGRGLDAQEERLRREGYLDFKKWF